MEGQLKQNAAQGVIRKPNTVEESYKTDIYERNLNWNRQIMGETKPYLDIFHNQMKCSVLGMGPMEPQPPPKKKPNTIAWAIGCSSQIDGKTLFLKTIPTLVTEHGEINLVPT